jgi:cytochrome c oxidase subunit 2
LLSKRIARLVAIPAVTTLALTLTGCAQLGDIKNVLDQSGPGLLPALSTGATDKTQEITNLWVGSWAILWVVGLIAWGLMFWAIIVYRRRKGDTKVPPQLRYNNPIETLFTVVPLILVVGFFAFTAKTMADIEKPYAPGTSFVKVDAIGKQWAWDFNYTDSNVHEVGIQAAYTGGASNFDSKTLPTLWLEDGVPVQIHLHARDVIHSFWVVDWLYKKDVIPGKDNNYIRVTPHITDGSQDQTFQGKCAELCGEYHSLMLFQDLQADPNTTGLLPWSLDRNTNLPGDNVAGSGGEDN